MPTNGQIATGPNGQRAIYQNGQWVVMGGAPAPSMPTNPDYQIKAAQVPYAQANAAADIAQAQAQARSAQATAHKTEALLPTEVAQAQASASKATVDARTGQNRLDAGLETAGAANTRADAIAGWGYADQLDQIIKDLETKYKAGPGSTSGPMGLADYFGGPKNAGFDKAADAARGIVGMTLGFTGGQLNSPQEAAANIGPFIPHASDWDSNIVDTLQRLKNLSDGARKRSVRILGGVPDANGRIVPLAPNQPIPSPWSPQGGVDMTLGHGAKFVTETDKKNAEALDNLYKRGASAGEMATFLRNAGATPDMAKLKELQDAANFRDQGKGFYQFVPAESGTRGAVSQGFGAAIDNPVGAGVAGAANMAGFGALQALAPDQYAGLGEKSDANSLAMMGGEVLGSIGGTGAIARMAEKGMAKFAPNYLPKLMAGGKWGEAGRNLATDMAYSGAYGATQGDVTNNFANGTLGSIGGQVAGRALGGLVGGVASPEARRLMDRGYKGLTVGQTVGGWAKEAEDRLAGMPFVSSVVNNRFRDGFRETAGMAANEVGSHVGYQPTRIGQEGLADLKDAKGLAYDAATAGVQVPLDQQFQADYGQARQASGQLPPDLSTKFDLALRNRVEPVATGPDMTGDQYQQAMRGLKGYKAEHTGAGFEEDYRGAINNVMGALKGNMLRNGGQGVVEGLANADASHRSFKALEAATLAAKNGTGTGMAYVPSPAQLNTAAERTVAKYPGPKPFGSFIDDAQAVLPNKVRDPGTAGQIAFGSLALAPAAIGGSAGAASGGADGGAEGLKIGGGLSIGTLAVLAAGGSKPAQKALVTALARRPAAAKRAGALIGKKSGLFGAAAVPFALEAGN